jgi:hypothetical protein
MPGQAGQVGLLLHELLVHGGPVFKHVGADTGFGFGVGGGVGVETHGFGGTAVGHGSREDQVGKGYFLIGDGGCLGRSGASAKFPKNVGYR